MHSLRLPIAIFLLFSLAIAATGYGVFRHQQQFLKRQAQENIAAIADLKTRIIVNWLAERREDARVFAQLSVLAKEVDAWLRRGAPADEKHDQLLQLLRGIQASHYYREVVLVDAQGQPRLSTSGNLSPLEPHIAQLAQETVQTGEVVLSDLHIADREPQSGPEIDLYAPLLVADREEGRVAAVLHFRIDPLAVLFTLIQSWPGTSASGETVLVRREGDTVLFLNELRHREDTALKFRLPLDSPDPAALAAQGQKGVMEGPDYRGVTVLAAVRGVPGTNWCMISKVDIDEVYAPNRQLAAQVTLIVTMLILTAGVLLLQGWRHQQARMLARQYQTEVERHVLTQRLDTERRQAQEASRTLEQKLTLHFGQSPLAYIGLDPEFVITDWNPAAEHTFGHSAAEAIGKSVVALLVPNHALEKVRPVMDGMRSGTGGARSSNENITKDGRSILCEWYNTTLTAADGRVIGYACLAEDVTEKRRAEEELRLAAQVFSSNREAIIIADANRNIVSVNRAFTAITGYTAGEAIGRNPRFLSSGRQGNDFYAAMWETINTGGYWQGELWNRRKSGEPYPQWLSITAVRDAAGKVTHYIGVSTDITERKRAEERVHHLAHHDILTDLPNRTLLNEQGAQVITAAQRDGDLLAVLFLDLDNFKYINDSLGHPVGDQLLRAVAGRLRLALRDVDMVSRLGGDEFVLVLPKTGVSGAAHVAKNVLSIVGQPYDIEHHRLTVTPSVGLAVYPHDGSDIETLVKNADAAMYAAKQAGRNTFRFFTSEMNRTAIERMTLENGLRQALEQNQFVLHYQPQIDIASGRLVGLEALVRWRHPQRGLVLPARFIPVAEDSGLILPIGTWVLREACRQNARWQQMELPPVPVAVNLSALQFRQLDFRDRVQDVLRETGLAPHHLELELTESILMEGANKIVAAVGDLARLGIRLSVDDFGTGYSSLAYLKRFPLNKLKVDRSFVRNINTDPDDAAIVRAVIHMAHSLRLKVIAEGVETAEQLDFLHREGCDEIQGYYASRPLPADDYPRWLAAHPEVWPQTPNADHLPQHARDASL